MTKNSQVLEAERAARRLWNSTLLVCAGGALCAPGAYATAQSVHFDFAGEVPGAHLQLQPDSDAKGYTATFAVPRSFLELNLTPNTSLRGDLEVRLSGAGSRGLQAMDRRYFFTPARPETTMVDDVPTEARLYPQYWGAAQVK